MYEDPHEKVTLQSPAEKALGDAFHHLRGSTGAAFFLVDLSRTMALLEEQRKGGHPGLTLTHLLVKACAEVLKKRPELGCRIVRYRYIQPATTDIGVSVAGARGGLSPVAVIRSADTKELGEIIDEVREETDRVRREEAQNLEKLSRLVRWIPFSGLRRWLIRLFFKRGRTVRELVGTFQISNYGHLGIDLGFSPIVLSTLMSVGEIRLRPMVKQGKIEIVPSSFFSIQGDHRIVDGKRAGDFMKDLKVLLDEPERLLPPAAE